MAARKNNKFFEIGRDAMLGMIEALDDGRNLTRRDVVLPASPRAITPKEIVRLRTGTFRVSQHLFARMLNVAPKTLQSWEQGRNSPGGASLRLIRLAQHHPEILLSEVRTAPRNPRRRNRRGPKRKRAM